MRENWSDYWCWTEFARARGRIDRWQARRDHAASGGATLTLGELERLIYATEIEAMATGDELALAVLLLRLEDMAREYDYRRWLGEPATGWPADDED